MTSTNLMKLILDLLMFVLNRMSRKITRKIDLWDYELWAGAVSGERRARSAWRTVASRGLSRTVEVLLRFPASNFVLFLTKFSWRNRNVCQWNHATFSEIWLKMTKIEKEKKGITTMGAIRRWKNQLPFFRMRWYLILVHFLHLIKYSLFGCTFYFQINELNAERYWENVVSDQIIATVFRTFSTFSSLFLSVVLNQLVVPFVFVLLLYIVSSLCL